MLGKFGGLEFDSQLRGATQDLGESFNAHQPDSTPAMGNPEVTGVPGYAIDYTTGAARKKKLDQATSGESSTTPKIRTRAAGRKIRMRTLADQTALLAVMHEERSVLCSVLPEFNHSYKDPVPPCILPKSLLCPRDPDMDGCEL